MKCCKQSVSPTTVAALARYVALRTTRDAASERLRRKIARARARTIERKRPRCTSPPRAAYPVNGKKVRYEML